MGSGRDAKGTTETVVIHCGAGETPGDKRDPASYDYCVERRLCYFYSSFSPKSSLSSDVAPDAFLWCATLNVGR